MKKRWVGSKFAACMWIYTKEALTGGQIGTRKVPEDTNDLHHPLQNWVCAGTFVGHECVSSRTSIQQKDEILSMVLDFKIDVQCVVHGASCGFSAPTNLNRILGQELKIKGDHEVVNSAFMNSIVRPFGGGHTPRSCMLTSVAKALHRPHKKW